MSKRSMHIALLVAVVTTLGFKFGGWATIAVDDLPHSMTVGQPTRLAFTVRQHGVTPLPELSPAIIATSGRTELHADARPDGNGHYEATITPTAKGPWTIEIRSGFMAANVKLLPITAIAPGAHAQPEPIEETGRRLFVAKGCTTCHVHGGVERQVNFTIGPDLTPKRYQADYLARFLANPAIARTPGQQYQMPAQVLKPSEVAALTAFINKP